MKKVKKEKNITYIYVIVLLLLIFSSTFIYFYVKQNETRTTKDDEIDISEVEDDDVIEAAIKPFSGKQPVVFNINGTDYPILLENNLAAYDLFNILPYDLTMEDLNNNEKYVYLSFSLTEEDNYTGKISKGDIVLYQSNCIVIFYKDIETENKYTKIGHIDELPDLGSESINVHIYY